MTTSPRRWTRQRTIVVVAAGLAAIGIVAPFDKGCSSGNHVDVLSPFKATLVAEPTTFVEGSIETVALAAHYEYR